MSTLNFASKGNHALSLPALLVATYLNDADPNTQIHTNVEDTETLQTGDNEVVDLVTSDGGHILGSVKIVSYLTQSHTSLQGKADLVSELSRSLLWKNRSPKVW